MGLRPPGEGDVGQKAPNETELEGARAHRARLEAVLPPRQDLLTFRRDES